MDNFEIIIIGAGPAGYEAAIKAGQLGKKTCLIEAEEIGGTCLIKGCIPTKTFISSVKILNAIQDAEDFGVEWQGEARINLKKIVERKNLLVERLVKGVKKQLRDNEVFLQKGRARIIAKDKIEVVNQGGKRFLNTQKIIIASGSRPALLPGINIDGERIITSDEALNLKEVPEDMLIIGGGVIGSEFASIFCNIGTKITVVELMPHLTPLLEEDLGRLLEREFKKKRIKVYTGINVKEIKDQKDSFQVILSNGEEIKTGHILVAVGRSYNTKDLGLEELGIKLGVKGNILVDERMETNLKGIYAVGDVIGGIMLAHIASQEGIVAAENAAGGEKSIDYSLIPTVVFSEPELSSVGLSEKRAEEKGYEIKIGRFNFRATGRAHTMNELIGEVKIVAERKSDRILGVHIIGANATELIHEAIIGMHHAITAKSLGESVHAHPTLSEAIMGAARTVGSGQWAVGSG